MGAAYYNNKDNRLKELKIYIDKYNSLDMLYTNNNPLWHAFKTYKHSLIDASKELGYENIHEIMKRKPNGYYNKFENLEVEIENLAKELGRFPTVSEIRNELGIDSHHISKHGGIYEIRKRMNCNFNDDLKDLSGFYNKSSYEYTVAMFLIKNNINYKREQYPFPKLEGDFRSDFMIETYDGKVVFVEVWGYSKNDNPEYYSVKEKKIELYKKYNLELISIEKDVFISNNKITINKILANIFQEFLNIDTVSFVNDILYPNKMSDEEILNEIMNYSIDENVLPDVPTLKKYGKYPLYNEILKRYGSYHFFAKKFNKENTRHEIGYWTMENIIESFKIINSKDTTITRKSISENNFSGMNDVIVDIGGLIKLKLLYLKELNSGIPLCEMNWLENVANNRGTNIKNRITFEQQLLAKDIIETQFNRAS